MSYRGSPIGGAAGLLKDTKSAELLLRSLDAMPRGEVWLTSVSRFFLTFVRLAGGDLDGALEQGRLALRGMARIQDAVGVSNTMAAVSWVATAQQRHADAALLCGASANIRHGVAPLLMDDAGPNALARNFQSASEQALGAEEFARVYTEGERMGLPQALGIALGEPSAPSPTAPATPTLAALTRREHRLGRRGHRP
ncbi:hypothetical protein P8605_03045 [Streptomyces sp. T-3]|nr:hypothetical protein [Streptomyces sp. T-3]